MNITIFRKETEDILTRLGFGKETGVKPFIAAEYLVESLGACMRMLATQKELGGTQAAEAKSQSQPAAQKISAPAAARTDRRAEDPVFIEEVAAAGAYKGENIWVQGEPPRNYRLMQAGKVNIADERGKRIFLQRLANYELRWKGRPEHTLTAEEKKKRRYGRGHLATSYIWATRPGSYLEHRRKEQTRNGCNPDNAGKGHLAKNKDAGEFSAEYKEALTRTYSAEQQSDVRKLSAGMKAFTQKWKGRGLAELSAEEKKKRKSEVNVLRETRARLIAPEKHAEVLAQRRKTDNNKQKQERKLKFVKFEDALLEGARKMGLDVEQIMKQG